MMTKLRVIVLAGVCGLAAVACARADLAAANALFKGGKWGEAREEFLKVIPTLKGDGLGRVLNDVGYTYLRQQKQLDASIAEYSKVLAMTEISPVLRSEAQLRIGNCFSLKQDYAAAYKHLMAVRDMPGAHPNHIIQGVQGSVTACLKLGDEDQALELLESSESIKGAAAYYYTQSMMSAGRIYQGRKQHEKALAKYKAAIDSEGATRHQREWARGYASELETMLAGDDPFYIKPFVLDVTPSSARVSWVTLGEMAPGTVKATGGGSQATATADIVPVRETLCHRHTATLEGLLPGVSYVYTVACGEKTISGAFKSAPTEDVPVTFAVHGDTQAAPHLHELVGNAIARDNPDFVIHVGDLTDKGSIWGKWRTEFFDPGWTYMKQCFIVPTVGNHDGGYIYPTLFDYRPLYYSFDYGNVHVSVVDSYWSGGSQRPKQLKWLEEDLAGTTKKWKIVSTHVPMVATREETKWFGKDDYLPLMEKYGVDVVVAGHHPMYRRYLPVGSPGAKPMLHITSGGGGPVGAPVPSPLVVKGAGVNHHTLFTVQGDTLELVAKLPDGTEIDRLKLVKTNGRYQDAVMDAAVDPSLAADIVYLYHDLIAERSYDMFVDFEETPRAGELATVYLDTATLPRGPLRRDKLPPNTSLVFSQKEGSPWTVEPQEQALDQDKVRFQVRAPADLSVGAGNMRPGLEFVVRLKVGDRLFESFAPVIRLTATTSARLAAGTDGLPLEWQFRFDPEDKGDAEGWISLPMDSPGWRRMSILSVWEVQSDSEYDGLGWYRASAKVPAIKEGHRLFLEFGAIDETCWLYVNGKLAGEQIYDSKVDDGAWEKPRRFDITDAVLTGQNQFVVKVRDIFGMGGIYGGAAFRQARPCVLANADFSEDLSGWTWGETDLSCSVDNGKYVGERSIRIETLSSEGAVVTRSYEALGDAADYTLSVRYRQSLLPSVGDVYAPLSVALVPAGDARPPIGVVTCGPESSADWAEASQILHVLPEQATLPLAVEIRVKNPGVYHVDEIRLSRAG